MASSLHTGYVAIDPTAYWGDYPVSAAVYHDMLDNAHHLHDEAAQVRVNFPNRGASFFISTQGGNGIGYVLGASFACPMSLRGDGTSFRLRVRVTGSVQQGTSAFKVVLSSADTAWDYAQRATPPCNVYSASTASTTPVELSPGTNLIYMDASMAREAIRNVSTYDAVSSGTPVDVGVCDSVLTVWVDDPAKTTCRIHGLYAAEYIGT